MLIIHEFWDDMSDTGVLYTEVFCVASAAIQQKMVDNFHKKLFTSYIRALH